MRGFPPRLPVSSTDGGPGASRRFSVVLADDTEDLRFILRRLLVATGRFDVVDEAEDGERAVEAAGRAQPDLLLLDLLMPVMDGFEALPHIRSVAPQTKVVVVSGQDRTLMEPRALELGAVAYIEKGTTSAEIVERLLRVME